MIERLGLLGRAYTYLHFVNDPEYCFHGKHGGSVGPNEESGYFASHTVPEQPPSPESLAARFLTGEGAEVHRHAPDYQRRADSSVFPEPNVFPHPKCWIDVFLVFTEPFDEP